MSVATRRFLLPLSILFIFTGHISFGQKKDTTQIGRIPLTEIREGKHLERAKAFSLEEFVQYYFELGAPSADKKYGEKITEVLYEDSAYTYFGLINTYGLIQFLKVKKADLEGINYRKIGSYALQERFFAEVVPVSDKERVARKQETCRGSLPGSFYIKKTRYIPASKSLKISGKWQVPCNGWNIINKTYTATYHLLTDEMIP